VNDPPTQTDRPGAAAAGATTDPASAADRQEFAGFDSTVYGPVRSWRFGWSLGIDLILETSTCSFDCAYCQLGPIQDVTLERRLFVRTTRVVTDLRDQGWDDSDVVTFSGSGEPTLALNLGEALEAVGLLTGLPTIVLTNGTTLGQPAVRDALDAAGRVELKMDAVDEETFRLVNRPVEGVKLEGILAGAERLRESYRGHLALQVMVMPVSVDRFDGLVEVVRRIRPDSIHLNTPRRPRPKEFYLASRGSHGEVPYPATPLKRVSPERLRAIGDRVAAATGVEVTLGVSGTDSPPAR